MGLGFSFIFSENFQVHSSSTFFFKYKERNLMHVLVFYIIYGFKLQSQPWISILSYVLFNHQNSVDFVVKSICINIYIYIYIKYMSLTTYTRGTCETLGFGYAFVHCYCVLPTFYMKVTCSVLWANMRLWLFFFNLHFSL